MTVTPSELARTLEELIVALDRRVPRLEQAGEAAIARDAAALRATAVDRLAELARNLPGPTVETADARDRAERRQSEDDATPRRV